MNWLRANLAEPVKLDLLAQVSGASPRTLERHFKIFLGTTPLGWARRLRLSRARQQLMHARPGARVTDVALSNGYTQLGRFAMVYQQAFGERPSTTIQRSRRAFTDGVDPAVDEALRLTWRALPLAFAVAPRQCTTALEELGLPQELAPGYGLPKAVAAWCWGQRAAHRFSSTPEADRRSALRLAEEAYRLSPHDALSLTLSSGALVLLHRLDDADRRLEQALALDPWLAYAWIRRGWMSAYLGDGEGAIRELTMALHLMPFEPLRHLAFIGMGCAHFEAERYDRAFLWIRSGVKTFPESHWAERVAIAAAVRMGSLTEAKRMGRRLMRKDPDLTTTEARRAWPFRPAFMSRLGDALEVAGVPRS